MPESLPVKMPAGTNSDQRTRDWIALGALSIGAVPLGLASLLYFAGRAPLAATLILLAVALIIGLVLRDLVRGTRGS